jgi:hypothetical protein
LAILLLPFDTEIRTPHILRIVKLGPSTSSFKLLIALSTAQIKNHCKSLCHSRSLQHHDLQQPSVSAAGGATWFASYSQIYNI